MHHTTSEVSTLTIAPALEPTSVRNNGPLIAEVRKMSAPDVVSDIIQLSFVGEPPNSNLLVLIILEVAKRDGILNVWSADPEHLYVRYDTKRMTPQNVLAHVMLVARPLYSACQLEITTATI